MNLFGALVREYTKAPGNPDGKTAGKPVGGGNKKGPPRAEITVFLSLVLVIMISVLFTVIDAARSNSAEFITECTADMALQSSLAEYNAALLEQYDLFFVDIGYGSREAGYILLEEHIKDYMQENYEIEGISLSGFIRDLLGMSAKEAAVSKASGAADNKGAVLERAAVDYMLDIAGMYDTSKLSSYVDLSRELEDRDVDERFRDTDSELSDFDESENPAGAVNKVRRSSSRVLRAVTEGREVSGVGITPEAYISSGNYRERNGFFLGENEANTAEDLIFQKYMMDKCGKYTKEKEDSLLKYQMEYVLKGKSSDEENLKEVVTNLVAIREAANFAHIMSDSGKQAEAELLALASIIVIFFPELLEVVKMAIIIAWSYAESLNDVRILLKGGRVPAFKTSASWKLSALDALSMNLHGEGDDGGLSYEEYLHVLLAAMNKEKRNMRFMDLIEMDIRKTPGNNNFCMDNCVNAYIVTMMSESSFGDSNMITRTAAYKK